LSTKIPVFSAAKVISNRPFDNHGIALAYRWA